MYSFRCDGLRINKKRIFRQTCHEFKGRAFSMAFTKTLLEEKRALQSPLALLHGVLYGRSLLFCPLLFQDFRVYSQICFQTNPSCKNNGFPCILDIPTMIVADCHTFPKFFNIRYQVQRKQNGIFVHAHQSSINEPSSHQRMRAQQRPLKTRQAVRQTLNGERFGGIRPNTH